MMYLRIAALAGVAILVATLLWYRGQAIAARAEREKAEAALVTAVEANRRQQEAIRLITKLREQDDKILLDMTEALAKLNEQTATTNATVAELERTNEDVRAYLSGAIPDDLKRVLNRER